MGYWSKSMEQFCKKAYKYIEEMTGNSLQFFSQSYA